MTEQAMTPETTEPETTEKVKLNQHVEIKDVGPCKKHIRIEVSPDAIRFKLNEQFSKIVADQTMAVAGFRPGKVPRRIVERRFHKDVSEQVKAELLLQSLEELAEDHDVAPLSPPDLDPASIDLPKDGPLVYEFEVEVRPQFDLPEYRGLTLKRPQRDITDEDVSRIERRMLHRLAVKTPKDGTVDIGDIVTAEVTIQAGDRVIGEIESKEYIIERTLSFQDGIARKFGEQLKGAKAGEIRDVDIELSELCPEESLRGSTVTARFNIQELLNVKLPEIPEDVWLAFGVHTQEQFREFLRAYIERQLQLEQRQAARQQVLAMITSASQWDLPRDLLARQAKATLNRQYIEMKSNGMADSEIEARMRLLKQDIFNSTARTLKEHFVLQKIAETEKIDIDEAELNDEIERLADQSNESPRRLRARLEKEDLLDSLAIELIERKVMDLILNSATYEDVSVAAEDDQVSMSDDQAVPGKMRDLAEEGEAGSGD